MGAYGKAEFDDNYHVYCERPWGNPGDRDPVTLGYIRKYVEPQLRTFWELALADDALNITREDRVCVYGCAYGWGVEILQELTGATVVGSEMSQYIHDTKDLSDHVDIEAACEAVGLKLTDKRVQEIKDYWGTVGPRTTATVLQEDMQTGRSRNNVSDELGGTPTYVITEDMISEMTDDEVDAFAKDADKFGKKNTEVIHLTGQKSRSTERLNELTGHTCIYVGSESTTKTERS